MFPRRFWAARSWWQLIAAGMVAACTGEIAEPEGRHAGCDPGERLPCACADGSTSGMQTCNADGNGLSACLGCSTSMTLSGGGNGATAGDAPGTAEIASAGGSSSGGAGSVSSGGAPPTGGSPGTGASPATGGLSGGGSGGLSGGGSGGLSGGGSGGLSGGGSGGLSGGGSGGLSGGGSGGLSGGGSGGASGAGGSPVNGGAAGLGGAGGNGATGATGGTGATGAGGSGGSGGTRDVPDTPACDPVADWPAAWVAWEDEVLSLVNQERAAGNTCGGVYYGPAPALTMEPLMRCLARLHSLDMLTRGFFSHINPDSDGMCERISNAGYRWSAIAENISAYATPTTAVATWMTSTGHCTNIMNSALAETGVGYAGDATEDLWTQTFGTPGGGSIANCN